MKKKKMFNEVGNYQPSKNTNNINTVEIPKNKFKSRKMDQELRKHGGLQLNKQNSNKINSQDISYDGYLFQNVFSFVIHKISNQDKTSCR